ncbi:efflux RND transporter permease subunit [Sinimarinibacterium sp. NLF-5-8]|uniref:efflux RND transporter permease subunit n=1 Tax=Sinimarinibacterium sp. NLF-5-8 TaxID=2698684 RepID=UPI00137BD6B9|nr:efflux RND transporter permease subunit [Sinimarinibacterium sp. NLF-5-8]QHS09683.1 efflux RND transporter permease subunit [Sinimarinibacterium sp. NLF-5-8]
MRITEFSVRNTPFMMVLFALLVAIGLTSLRDIPRTEDPYFQISAFSVIAIYPGADPLELERQVVEPIEDAINKLDDVKEMVSTADDGVGIVRVEFEAHVDVDKKYDEVMRELGALRLPEGVVHFEVQKINPGTVYIVQPALVSQTASWNTLEDWAEEIVDRFERVPGVLEAESWAYPERELRVELDLKRLAELNLRATQVLNAIKAGNINVPGGAIETGARRFNIKTTGNYQNLEQIRNTVVAGDGQHSIRVNDIATVKWAQGPDRHLGRFNGQRAVFITANQKAGQNIFITRNDLYKVLDEVEPLLPAGVRLERGFDQSRNVAKRLDRLSADFMIAIVLVCITLLPLGLRAAGLVMVSIPLSLAMGLAALYFAGFSLNQMSIAGFVVALGLLVDDSIVVTENIARFLRGGHSRNDAAILATRQIALAILGCTATLLFAFLPLLALPGNAGKFVRSLPLAVVLTVIASLFVSLTIIPFLASRVLPKNGGPEGNILLQKLMGGIHRIYAPLLRRALARPKTTMLIAAFLALAPLALVPLMGTSLFPKADTPQFLIKISLPDGTSLTHTDTVLREVEAILDRTPEVDHYFSNLGRGNPRIYYNVFQHEYAANYAEVFVQLHNYQPKTTPVLLDALRDRFDHIAGAEILVKQFENGPPMEAPIAVRILGPDLDQLRALAAQIEALTLATPGTRDVTNPLRRTRIDLDLNIDRVKAGLLGIAPLELDQTVRLAVAGISAGEFHQADGDSYPIVLRTPLHGNADLSALEGLHLGTVTGAQVPLAQVTQPRLSESQSRINRRNRERAVSITAYTQTGANTAQLTQAIVKQLDAFAWPTGYRYEMGGEVEGRKDSFEGFGTAILVALFGILAVLVLEFGSFKSTLIVAGVIPLGIMGGILMLFITGFDLSFTAMLGLIALIGIEIKNSILLVDFTNQLREQGKPLDDAIAEAGEIRFLPILLTSITAIGGLMPLAIQNSPLYSPMAWVIIGGLITSTLIGRLVTPVMYKLLPPAMRNGNPPIFSDCQK